MPLDAAIKPKPARSAKPAAPSRAQRATEKTAAIASAFQEIGRVNGTMMPLSKKADDKLAWEYFAASELSSLAEKRRDVAKLAAVKGGVIPDYSAHPLEVGTSATAYISDLLTIGVKVTAQADRVNVLGLVADLKAAGVETRLLKRLVKRHTKSFAGAHSVTALLTG
jgi:hypothetical protein